MAFSEFYCGSGGSNLNAGSTQGAAVYTSIHGNWVNATGVFTPTDGVNPSLTVSVGMFASVYVDGTTPDTVYVGRITVVTNAVNGAITANTAPIGAKPANQTATATMKVGGVWLGPNAATGFPFTLANYGNNLAVGSAPNRTNLKNDQTYSLTASFASNTAGSKYIVQGYTSTVNDGGKATIDGGTSTGALLSATGKPGTTYIDLIFKTSISSGSTDLVITGGAAVFIRCVFTGSRQKGLSATSACAAIECEAYGNNTSNAGNTGGFHQTAGAASYLRCVSHDNTGSNTAGFVCTNVTGSSFNNCISDTNGSDGFQVGGNAAGSAVFVCCDTYKNGNDGIRMVTSGTDSLWIDSCNFIQNSNCGIENIPTTNWGYVYNCGYGAGTQANGSGDVLNAVITSGAVTYASNVAPWVDPDNGDFRINLLAAKWAGRGAFTETATSYTGTIGYPDIGAAQATAPAAGGGLRLAGHGGLAS